MDVQQCVALHNQLFALGLAGVGTAPPAARQDWFAFYGDDAEAVRDRLSPSLVAFLAQAWTSDENEHALFYYASGLAYPGSLWTSHDTDNQEAGRPNRYLTLYAATDVAEHPEGVVFDQETHLAIVQMSIHDAGTTHNGRQTWFPLETVLRAWLDMVASGKVQAVSAAVEAPNGKYDPWILLPYSPGQLDETVDAFDRLVEAIEARMPAGPTTADRPPLLTAASMDAAHLPHGFARSFLGRVRQPRFRFLAPGLEVPQTAAAFADQPFPADGDEVNIIPPILLFRSAASFVAPAPEDAPVELPFAWPYSDTPSYPAGLYLTDTDRESGTEYEDGAKLVLPFGIGAHGFARTADGARFGENKESRLVEAKDTFADLYQPGYIPFAEQHEARLAHVLQAWRKQVESGQWSVGPEGVLGGMGTWREADTENGWQGYVIPVSW